MSDNILALFGEAGLDDVDVLEEFTQGLTATAAKKDGGGSLEGCELLKMGKNDGEWCFGLDGDLIEEDELIVINVLKLQHGYIDWNNGQIAGESMVSVMKPLPDMSASPTGSKKGWEEQLQFDARFLEDEGDIQLRYKQNSQGGREAIREICSALVAQLNSGETKFIFPVISLGCTSYKHSNREYGTIYKPEFTIEFWVDTNGKKQPKGKNKLASKKAEKEDVKEEEAPKRRRRKG